MKHVQIRLEDQDFEHVDRKRHELRYPSLQQALKDAVLRWADTKQPPPPSPFLKLAAAFEASAPREILQLIEDNMRRLVRVEEKIKPRRRKKTG